MVFDQVPGAVTSGACDAGLLIHEAQLTFAELGLRAVADMGVWWQGHAGTVLPLGLNVIRRDLDQRLGAGGCARVSRVLSRSVAYAVEHAAESQRYLLLHAEDRPEWRDPGLVERYLSMYVSRMSLDMGEAGASALRRFLGEGHERGLCADPGEVEVV
jgi:1,4-dihydroxy-6-naphthoate synthase